MKTSPFFPQSTGDDASQESPQFVFRHQRVSGIHPDSAITVAVGYSTKFALSSSLIIIIIIIVNCGITNFTHCQVQMYMYYSVDMSL